MLALILKRALATIPVLVLVVFVVFALMYVVPGDPAAVMLGPQATPEQVEALQREMGLDQPVHIQFVEYLQRLAVGDMGTSTSRGVPVLGFVMERLANTTLLALTAVGVAVVAGVLVGLVAASRAGKLPDRVVMLGALFANSMPPFWFGIVLIMIFALWLGWLPVSGMQDVRGGGGLIDLARHMVLPTLTLAAWSIGIVARITRSAVLDVDRLEYISTARSRGFSERRILLRHALPNAMIPVVTVIGLQVGYLIGGAVLTETVFAWPGVGFAMYQAIQSRDLPLIQGGILILSLVVIVTNLLVDIVYMLINPRVRVG